MSSVNLNMRLIRLVSLAGNSLLVSVIFSIAGGLILILQAYSASQVIAQVFIAGKELSQVLPGMFTLLGLILTRSIIHLIADGTASQGAISIKSALREKLLNHLVNLGPAYTESKPAGELVAVAMQGIESIESYFSQYLPQVILAISLPLMILAAVFPIDLLTGLIFLITVPLIPLFMTLIGSMASRLTRKQFDALQHMSGFLLDTIRLITTIKVLGQSKNQERKIIKVSERYRQTTLEVLRLTFLSALVLELVATIATAVVAVEVGLRLLYWNLEFEQAFFILLIAPEFYQPLRQLGLRYHAAASGLSAAERLNEIFDTLPSKPAILKERPGEGEKLQVDEVRFEHVSFRYPERTTDSLNDLSLILRKGTLTVVTGPSGSGKSSLIKLLLRFQSPQSGRILIDGAELDSIDLAAWRSRVSFAPQQPVLLKGSLLENIRLARPDAEMADIQTAVRWAGISDLIERLPLGFDTQVGEGGGGLSGGQRQRISLARAFLKKAPVLIMDEPSSHQDPHLQRELDDTLLHLAEVRIILIIAHRIETIQRADQVVILDNGNLVDIGIHSTLIEKNYNYRRLFSSGRLYE